MSAYVMIYQHYPYVPPAKVVTETIEEYFDENGKLTSRTKTTVTKYEEKPSYQQWYGSQGATPAIQLRNT